MSKILKFNQLKDLRKSIRPDWQIIHCHGVFDILHVGHLEYFKSAKAFNNKSILVVTITADRYVNKGPGKPIFTAEIRAEMLAALKIVDYVAISDHPTAVPAIEQIKPDYYVKGPDYRDKTKDITGEIYNEEIATEGNGGKVVFTNDETYSSSVLANRFFVKWTDQQKAVIDRINSLGGMDRITKCLDDIAKLKVMLVGEPIVDTYIFCEPQNISSKSPSISAKYLYTEDYQGGATAIANHLASFVHSVQFVVPQDFKIPQKIRYIAVDKAQRMFELTDIKDDHWVNENPKGFILDMLRIARLTDMSIIADFGHGLFEGPVLSACDDIPSFKAVNVQTNSSNYGFNPYTKHENIDYLSIDTREARIAHHDRHTAPIRIAVDISAMTPNVSLTMGSNGACFVKSGVEYICPAFTDSVVDATGAGDAYFAITSALVKVDAPAEFIPFIGNVYAGLKTKIIGNKSSVTKAQLIKALQGVLK